MIFGEVMGDEVVQCIRTKLMKDILNPFAYFYALPEIHKPGPKGSKTRPTSSSCNDLQHQLTKLINKILLPLATSQKLYLNNSFQFKKENIKIPIAPTCSVSTYDAVELYPSILIDLCLNRITSWFEKKKIFKVKSSKLSVKPSK